jgi:hypothetical protein
MPLLRDLERYFDTALGETQFYGRRLEQPGYATWKVPNSSVFYPGLNSKFWDSVQP